MEGAMKSISGGKTVLILAGLLMTAVPLSWTRARPQNEQTPPPMEQKEGMNPMFLFMSMPDGGTEAILKNLVYPESARKLGVEGEVTVRVQYTEKGFKDAAIEKSEFNVGGKGKEYELAAKECGEAALKAVRSVTWTPIKGASSAGGSFMIPLKFKLDQKKEKAPAVSGKIYGSVKDVGGKPLEGAAIAIEGTEFKAFSDASGNFFIIQVPPGEYDLKAVKPGYESISLQAVKISVGKNTHFDILLKEIPAPDEEAAPPPPPAPPPLPAPEGNSFVPFDTAPEPVEGYAVIQKNVVYPELAVKAGVEGVVIVQADIDENGNVTGTKIQQSLGANGCDESAVNAIRSVQWKPAQKDGRPVAVSVYIPVDFKMGKK
jgi:TonB family protein